MNDWSLCRTAEIVRSGSLINISDAQRQMHQCSMLTQVRDRQGSNNNKCLFCQHLESFKPGQDRSLRYNDFQQIRERYPLVAALTNNDPRLQQKCEDELRFAVNRIGHTVPMVWFSMTRQDAVDCGQTARLVEETTQRSSHLIERVGESSGRRRRRR